MTINPHEKNGKKSGNWFLGANTLLTAKGPVKAIFEGDHLTWSSVYSDPLSAVVGLTFITSALVMKKGGSDNTLFGVSMGLGATGNTILAGNYIHENYPITSIIGACVGAYAGGYAAYKSYVRHQDSKEKVTKKESKLQEFQENKGNILQKYPYAISGLISFATNVAMMVGALQAKEPDWIMAAVTALWCVGSTYLGLSLPKVKDSIPA
jgi:hypothetical protein